MNFWQELRRRWALESPEFFEKIARFGAWLMGVALLVLAPEMPAGVGIEMPQLVPPIVVKIASYVFVAGVMMNRIAKLTVKDPSKL